LTVADTLAFERMCKVAGRLAELEAEWEEFKSVNTNQKMPNLLVTRQGARLNPYPKEIRELEAHLNRYLGQFGLTPGTRMDVRAIAKPKAALPGADLL